MSSISSVGAASASNPYLNNLAGAFQSSFGQTIKDFQAIGTALKSGDLGSAKSAVMALQKDLPANLEAGAGQLFGKNTQASTDFQKLTSALQSGDLAGAQKAFGALAADLKASTTGGSSADSSFGSTLSNLLAGTGVTG